MNIERIKLNLGKEFISLKVETEEQLKEVLDLINNEPVNDNKIIHITAPLTLKLFVKNLNFPEFVIFFFEGSEVTQRIDVSEEDSYKVIEEYAKLVANDDKELELLIEIGKEAILNAETQG